MIQLGAARRFVGVVCSILAQEFEFSPMTRNETCLVTAWKIVTTFSRSKIDDAWGFFFWLQYKECIPNSKIRTVENGGAYEEDWLGVLVVGTEPLSSGGFLLAGRLLMLAQEGDRRGTLPDVEPKRSVPLCSQVIKVYTRIIEIVGGLFKHATCNVSGQRLPLCNI